MVVRFSSTYTISTYHNIFLMKSIIFSVFISADASNAGNGDLNITVYHEGHPVHTSITEERMGLHKIDFTPQGAGVYKVHVSYNDNEVKGIIFFLPSL